MPMALVWVAQAASFLSMSLYSFLPLLYISGWFLSHSAFSSCWASVILTSLFFLYPPWHWLSWVVSSNSSVSSGWVAVSPGSENGNEYLRGFMAYSSRRRWVASLLQITLHILRLSHDNLQRKTKEQQRTMKKPATK